MDLSMDKKVSIVIIWFPAQSRGIDCNCLKTHNIGVSFDYYWLGLECQWASGVCRVKRTERWISRCFWIFVELKILQGQVRQGFFRWQKQFSQLQHGKGVKFKIAVDLEDIIWVGWWGGEGKEAGCGGRRCEMDYLGMCEVPHLGQSCCWHECRVCWNQKHWFGIQYNQSKVEKKLASITFRIDAWVGRTR